MLISPLNRQHTPLIIINFLILSKGAELGYPILVLNGLVTDRSGASVTAGGVVLGIEETVAVVAVGVSFAVAVVGATGVVPVMCVGGGVTG